MYIWSILKYVLNLRSESLLKWFAKYSSQCILLLDSFDCIVNPEDTNEVKALCPSGGDLIECIHAWGGVWLLFIKAGENWVWASTLWTSSDAWDRIAEAGLNQICFAEYWTADVNQRISTSINTGNYRSLSGEYY